MKKIKNITVLLLYIFMADNCLAQSISINTDGSTANASAILDIKSTDKGMLTPRVTNTQKNSIVSPANGLLVYQTDGVKGFWVYDGGIWKNLTAAQAGSAGLITSSGLQNGIMIVAYTGLNAYGFTANVSSTPTWYPQALSDSVYGAIATDSSIVVFTATTAYGFARNVSGTPTWYAQSLSGTPTGIAGAGNIIMVSTTTGLYGFTRNISGTPSWYSQTTASAAVGVVTCSKDCIVMYTVSTAYGFTRNVSGTPSWYSQSLTGTPINGTSSGKLIVIYTSDNCYGFARNVSGTPSWYLQSLIGIPLNIVPQ